MSEQESFEAEVARCFAFLVDSYDMDGPSYSERLLPGVSYDRPELSISIYLDSGDGAGVGISVSISLPVEREPGFANLADLVEAARFAPRHLVAGKAHTWAALCRTLADNALWVGRLMPLLLGPGAIDLISASKAQPLDRAGNPKRRPPNIKWKYV
jgi:hypothetical protein